MQTVEMHHNASKALCSRGCAWQTAANAYAGEAGR